MENPLGKTVSIPQQRNAAILFRIPRASSRKGLGITDSLPFQGFDEWNSYEFSWLDGKGKPQRCFLQLCVPCSSPYLVESKSLKLYFGSYLQEKFTSASEVEEAVAKDLSALLETDVQVAVFPITSSLYMPKEVAGICLDEQDLSVDLYEYSPAFLQTEQGEAQETLYTHLFKSNCPVTGQPDYATVIVSYKGKKLCRESLLRYLISYRDHQEYHECCVERIFQDLCTQCSPQVLSVAARFSRRGGIDINPYRYTPNAPLLERNRLLFQ